MSSLYTPLGGDVGGRAQTGVVLLRKVGAHGNADDAAGLRRRLGLGSDWVVGHGGSIAPLEPIGSPLVRSRAKMSPQTGGPPESASAPGTAVGL